MEFENDVYQIVYLNPNDPTFVGCEEGNPLVHIYQKSNDFYSIITKILVEEDYTEALNGSIEISDQQLSNWLVLVPALDIRSYNDLTGIKDFKRGSTYYELNSDILVDDESVKPFFEVQEHLYFHIIKKQIGNLSLEELSTTLSQLNIENLQKIPNIFEVIVDAYLRNPDSEYVKSRGCLQSARLCGMLNKRTVDEYARATLESMHPVLREQEGISVYVEAQLYKFLEYPEFIEALRTLQTEHPDYEEILVMIENEHSESKVGKIIDVITDYDSNILFYEDYYDMVNSFEDDEFEVKELENYSVLYYLVEKIISLPEEQLFNSTLQIAGLIETLYDIFGECDEFALVYEKIMTAEKLVYTKMIKNLESLKSGLKKVCPQIEEMASCIFSVLDEEGDDKERF